MSCCALGEGQVADTEAPHGAHGRRRVEVAACQRLGKKVAHFPREGQRVHIVVVLDPRIRRSEPEFYGKRGMPTRGV